jgi:hypothetical protein
VSVTACAADEANVSRSDSNVVEECEALEREPLTEHGSVATTYA